jgi:hypothetical protein
VLVGMLFRCMLVVFGGMKRMAMRHLRMMRRFFVIPGLGVLCRLAVMLGGLLVMFRRLLVMVVDIMAFHSALPTLKH